MPYFVIFDGLLSYDHSANAQEFWQGQKDLNPRHAVLETAALPTELYPYVLTSNNITDYYEKSKCFFIFIYHKNKKPPKRLFWWANRDSNPGPTGYEPVALTN